MSKNEKHLDHCYQTLTVRDLMWTWGHRINGSYGTTDEDSNYGIPGWIDTSPYRAAQVLGVPNIIMLMRPTKINEAAEVRALRRIVWEVKLEEDFDFSRDLLGVVELQKQYKNIEGIILDDFTSTQVARGVEPELLGKLRYALQTVLIHPLSIWATVYTMNLDHRTVKDCLSYLDVIYLCCWDAKDLPRLENNFKKCEKLAQGRPIVLGLYMWDYCGRHELTVDLMKFQCNQARTWLRQKRIAGMVFMPSGLAEKDFEAVTYVREWIKEVGSQPLWK